MAKSKIEWCDKVWNPVTGCTKISPGCQNCYAERMSKRLAGRCGYSADNPFEVTLHPERLGEPLKWKRSSKIFVCSMGDLFHEDVPFEFLAKIWEVFYNCGYPKRVFHSHTFIVLTKRPERMLEFAKWYRKEKLLPINYSNVWLGVTAENQEQADKRIPILLHIPAVVRFVSIEPMLGPIKIPEVFLEKLNWGDGPKEWPDGAGIIDWVICGGETGPRARPMHLNWVRDIREQCKDAGVPFLFKSWGEYLTCDYEGKDFGAPYIDSQCINGELWDLDQCDENGLYSCGDNPICPKCKGTGFLKVGKKKAGRLLDGREWNEFPK